MLEGRTASKHSLMSGLLPRQRGSQHTGHPGDTVLLRGKPAGLSSTMAYPSVVDGPLNPSLLGTSSPPCSGQTLQSPGK